MEIVEQQRDEVRRDDHGFCIWLRGRCAAIGRRRVGIRLAAVPRHLPGGFFHRETRYRLLFAVIEKTEIFLGQVGDGLALGIANHHGHQYQIGLGFEGRRRLLSRDGDRKEE